MGLAAAVVLGVTTISEVADAAPAPKQTATRRVTTPPRQAHVPVDAALVSRARAQNEATLREAMVAQYAAAVAEYYRPKTGVDWDGIARCETGANWSMRGPRYSGGLGFYNGTWTGFGGREFAANAGSATREQQIIVAERVYARHGLTGWGCRAYG